MAADPGSKAYGRLTVMLQSQCAVQSLFDIGPHAFRPAPKVDSAFVRITPYRQPRFEIEDPSLFARIVAQAFSQRRKTLRNTWKTARGDGASRRRYRPAAAGRAPHGCRLRAPQQDLDGRLQGFLTPALKPP